MTKIPFFLRMFGAGFGRLGPFSEAPLEDVQKLSDAGAPRHNPMIDLLMGGIARGVTLEERTMLLPDREITLRVFTPKRDTGGPLPLVVYYHGGGFVIGKNGGDWTCARVARDLGAVVASIEYRLAPRHRFPAAVDDAYDGLVWCVEHAAELGADAANTVVMGESAGATLAAVVCLMALRRGPAIRHQTLVYPMTEATLSTESCERNRDEIILTLRDAKAFMDYYFGPDADRRDFRASPLLAPDHAGLPPAFIVAAGHDPLHDDAVMYAEKLEAASVPVTLRDYPRMCHGFFTFPHMGLDAKPALAEIVADVRTWLDRPPTDEHAAGSLGDIREEAARPRTAERAPATGP